MRNAYFAGGCFWCITPFLRLLDGVLSVTAGYSGGTEAQPRYEQVKAQKTGHRETVRVSYDPALVSYAELLTRFLENVDPFDGDGQYIDRGRSYTLAVYWERPEDRDAAAAILQKLEAEAGRKPQVSLEPFAAFWEAEAEHQDFDRKHPQALAEELRVSGRKAEINPRQYRFSGWETADVRDARGLTPRDYYDLLLPLWSAETCAPRLRSSWSPENPTLGQCSVTAFLMQDLYGGEVYGVPLADGNFHCFNVVRGCRFDLTSEQFCDEVLDYENCPVQRRETHFAKEEKRLRYESLRGRLLRRLG